MRVEKRCLLCGAVGGKYLCGDVGLCRISLDGGDHLQRRILPTAFYIFMGRRVGGMSSYINRFVRKKV